MKKSKGIKENGEREGYIGKCGRKVMVMMTMMKLIMIVRRPRPP